MTDSEEEPDPDKLCFVIGPIGDEGTDQRIHADWLLEGIIKPVFADFPEFEVRRADHDPRPGLIDAQMINDLLNAELVIADLSFSNPNAFYEIGIRHMAQKPIIHMQLAGEKAPFDLSLYRAIKFSREQYRDLDVARAQLKASIEATLAKGYQVENPVTNARGRFKLDEYATPGQQIIIDQLRAIEQRLSKIESFDEFEAPFTLAPQASRSTPHTPPLKVGEIVHHHKFGRGPITLVDESKLTVDFPGGTKRVIDSFVNRVSDG
jgi:hypothetical protein